MALTIPDYDDPDLAASYGKRPMTTRAEFRVLSRLLGDLPIGSVVVDVPCGNGRLAKLLRTLSPERLVGIDGSAAMVTRAREAYDGALAGDASRLPLGTGSADLVISMRLLHHFRDPADRRAILCELRRVSRGIVIVSYYSRWSFEGQRRSRSSARVGLSRREFTADLGAAGLNIVKHRSLLPFVREQTLVLARAREKHSTLPL